MKKILILSEFFPPCNLTPAERIYSFARYLNESGYYPIIVTRNWDIPIAHFRDEKKATGKTVTHIKESNFEVYYVPFRPTIRDRLFLKYEGTGLYILYLITSFIYDLGEQLSSHFTSYLPLYRQCKKILCHDKSISLMLISGTPFHLFKFGYKLKKKFAIKWVADYRDDWNTSQIRNQTGFRAIGKNLSRRNEIKWVSSASFFTTVSDYYVKKISSFLKGRKGYTVLNGYMKANYLSLPKTESASFVITYVGTLYATQPIEIFLEGYKKFIDSMPSIDSKVNFIGLQTQPRELLKTKQIVQGYESRFNYTSRVSKKDAILMQNSSTLLLLCAHTGFKGTPGSKLYEYVGLKKPVLVCPSDGEIMEETLILTGQGYFANNSDECAVLLKKLYELYGTGSRSALNIREDEVAKFSRYENTLKLGALLDTI